MRETPLGRRHFVRHQHPASCIRYTIPVWGSFANVLAANENASAIWRSNIPVASIFFYNFDDMRSTGKFLGMTSQGAIENKPAGAFIRTNSRTIYEAGEEPV